MTKHVSPSEFVRIWETSESSEQAAARLGLSKGTAWYRASALRKAGVKLRKFRRNVLSATDAQQLNRLIEELAEQGKNQENTRQLVALVDELGTKTSPPVQLRDVKPEKPPAPKLADGRRELIAKRAASAGGDFPRVARKIDEEDDDE